MEEPINAYSLERPDMTEKAKAEQNRMLIRAVAMPTFGMRVEIANRSNMNKGHKQHAAGGGVVNQGLNPITVLNRALRHHVTNRPMKPQKAGVPFFCCKKPGKAPTASKSKRTNEIPANQRMRVAISFGAAVDWRMFCGCCGA